MSLKQGFSCVLHWGQTCNGNGCREAEGREVLLLLAVPVSSGTPCQVGAVEVKWGAMPVSVSSEDAPSWQVDLPCPRALLLPCLHSQMQSHSLLPKIGGLVRDCPAMLSPFTFSCILN